MNTEKLYPGKKIKYKDKPDCDCSTCEEMKGSIVTVKHVYPKNIAIEEIGDDITVDERHIEDTVFQMPEELFEL